MKLKSSNSHSAKQTVAVFVRVEGENATVCSFDKTHKDLFNKLYAEKNYTPFMSYAMASSLDNRILFITFREVKNYTLETWRKAGSLLVSAMKDNRIKDIEVDTFALFADLASEDDYASFCVGIILASYTFTKYLGEKRLKDIHNIESITLVSDRKEETSTAIDIANKTAKNICWARDMVNEPSNVINALTFVEAASIEAKARNIKTSVLDEKKLKELGMNGILGVNAGSKNPPRLFIAEYKHPSATKTILFVGKGITFDSGGMSLKPSDSMVTMKDDMAGAAAACAALFLLADKKVFANVTVVAALTDNKTGSGAINPSDILTMYNGVTVEVANTDAEGRIILGDALAYGIREFKPNYVIDIATLTGACPVALGKWASGLMGNDDTLIEAIKAAGDDVYERVWNLPMHDEYKDAIKSPIADIKNTGGRLAGTIVAAHFLSYFIDDAKWAHIDIAATAFFDKASGYIPEGGTGIGVQLLARSVERLIEN